MLYPRVTKEGDPVNENQMVGVNEHLLHTRRICFLSGQFTGSMDAHNCLLALDDLSHDPIKLVITSVGGDLDSAFLLYDTICLTKAPIYTLGRYCASAAALILAAGKKRYLMPHAKVMLHPHRMAMGGGSLSDTDLEVVRQESKKYKEKMVDILIDCGVKKTPEAILMDIENKDFWLEPEEAIKYGLADKIMDKKTLGGWLRWNRKSVK